MPYPSPGATKLTGAIRYRTDWRGKVILQVEERNLSHHVGSVRPGSPRTPVFVSEWRDAKEGDLLGLDYIAQRARNALKGEPPPAPLDWTATGEPIGQGT